MKKYRLKGCFDIEECPEKEERYWSCKNLFRNYIDGWRVSTIFLCEDHNYNNIEEEKEPPILFETMVFNQKGDIVETDEGSYKRFATYKQAAEYHNKCVYNIMRQSEYMEIT